jgi:hypothetical protein
MTLVAAYFAASGAVSALANGGQCIAVWALNQSRLDSIASQDERIIVVTPPWATNPNLRAQRGLFTLHGVRLVAHEKTDHVPLDEAVEKLAVGARSGHGQLMCLLRLPVEQAPLLMTLLSQEGVNAASIFPGYDGVVKSLREEHGAANYRDDQRRR